MTDTATVTDDRNGAPEGVVHSHAEAFNEDDFAIVEASGPDGTVRFTVPATNTDKTVRIEHGGPDRIIDNVPNPFAAEDTDLDPDTDDVIFDPATKSYIRRVAAAEGGGGAEATAGA